MNDILGGNGEDECFEGFGSGFEAERLVKRGEPPLRFGSDIEIEASSLDVMFMGHVVFLG